MYKKPNVDNIKIIVLIQIWKTKQLRLLIENRI